MVNAISNEKKRRRIREGSDVPNIRRGIMRIMYIIVDMSVSLYDAAWTTFYV